MSHLTTCNYCNWRQMKRDGYRFATSEDIERLRREDEGFSGSSGGIYVLKPDGSFAAWFMELTSHCAC